MDKKNTMLLTVIAVATLLVAVVGATFAYYSVSQSGQSSTRTVTTTTPPIGAVTLTQGLNNLYLNITGAEMADSTEAKTTYYHTTTNDPAVTTSTATPVATLAVTGDAGNTTTYSCKFDYSVSTASAPAGLTAGDAQITLAYENNSGSTITFTNFPSTAIDLTTTTSSAVSGTVQMQVTGNTNTSITALAEFDTAAREQSNIAGTEGMVTTVTIDNLRCLTGTTYPS